MGNATNIPTELDYFWADRNQPRLPERPNSSSLRREISRTRSRTIKRKDPITGRYRRIKTDGKSRQGHYSDSGEILE